MPVKKLFKHLTTLSIAFSLVSTHATVLNDILDPFMNADGEILVGQKYIKYADIYNNHSFAQPKIIYKIKSQLFSDVFNPGEEVSAEKTGITFNFMSVPIDYADNVLHTYNLNFNASNMITIPKTPATIQGGINGYIFPSTSGLNYSELYLDISISTKIVGLDYYGSFTEKFEDTDNEAAFKQLSTHIKPTDGVLISVAMGSHDYKNSTLHNGKDIISGNLKLSFSKYSDLTLTHSEIKKYNDSCHKQENTNKSHLTYLTFVRRFT